MGAASLAVYGLALGLALGWLTTPLAPGAPDRPEPGLIRGRAMPAEWPGP
jgi:hypothetical protein